MQSIRKREGFDGQRAIVLPNKTKELCSYTPPTSALYITDIGFYPRARYHFRERPAGISQNILIYCAEGKGWAELPGGRSEINPNDFLVIPADMPHMYGADEANPWTIYWIHFKGAHASFHASLLTNEFRNFVNYAPFLEERIRIFDAIYGNFELGYSFENLVYNSACFSYFLMSFRFANKFCLSSHPLHAKDAVDSSIEYMQENLEKTLTLLEIASSVNLSVSRYSSLFRKKTGYPPMVYFNHLKIQRACQYLQFSTLRVNEIAGKLGIHDPYYFSRLFSKVMGVSPQEYRNKTYV